MFTRGVGAARFYRQLSHHQTNLASERRRGGALRSPETPNAGLDPIPAKHLVRIPLGTSRLGVGDATILAALNQTRLGGTKVDQLALEDGYNRLLRSRDC